VETAGVGSAAALLDGDASVAEVDAARADCAALLADTDGTGERAASGVELPHAHSSTVMVNLDRTSTHAVYH
jgi:hypothetical protein